MSQWTWFDILWFQVCIPAGLCNKVDGYGDDYDWCILPDFQLSVVFVSWSSDLIQQAIKNSLC